MERKLFSVLFCIRRTKLNKSGEAPITLRITYDRQSVELQIEHPQIEKILERYASKLNWRNIANNSNISWTPQMVSQFEQYLAEVENIERTNLWGKLAERRAEEIVSEIFEK